jgi:lysyl-tRNA synthetase class 2
MKPEAQLKGSIEGSSEVEGDMTKLSSDEKAVLNLLNTNSPIDLNALKEQAGLSNKKWDKAIKGLTKNKLARVEKTGTGLLVSLG